MPAPGQHCAYTSWLAMSYEVDIAIPTLQMENTDAERVVWFAKSCGKWQHEHWCACLYDAKLNLLFTVSLK